MLTERTYGTVLLLESLPELVTGPVFKTGGHAAFRCGRQVRFLCGFVY